MEWKGLRHKKSHVFKKISIRSLKWVYDITETVLCTMHGVGEKPWRSFTSVKQDWHQLKVNQNLQESKRNCFYFDKLQTSTCSCTIFVIVSSVGCGLCNSTHVLCDKDFRPPCNISHLTISTPYRTQLASHYVGSPKLESTQLRQTGKEHSTSPWASWHKLKKTNFFVIKLKSLSADDVINRNRFMTWSSLNVLYVYSPSDC